MNLLCPNCQKMLTVPEQFAGQMMKCPLCSGTFTVPALPSTVSSEEIVLGSPAFTTPPPLENAAPTVSEPPASQEVYEMMPAFTAPTPPSGSKPQPASPQPAFATTTPQVSSTPATATPPAANPRPAPSTPSNYAHSVHLQANPRILKYIPSAAILMIFVLLFFPWVGVYPGGVPAVTQNAFDAAFGWYSTDPDMKDGFRILTEKDVAEINENNKGKSTFKEISNDPNVSLLCLFYLIPFFAVTLVVSIFLLVEPFLTVKLPPQVEQLLPWKWAILAGLNAILLLFLSLQLVLNFSLESRVQTWIENRPEIKKEKDLPTHEAKKQRAILGNFIDQIRRTSWLRLVFLLHVIATTAAMLVYWLERRGQDKPLPTLEVRW